MGARCSSRVRRGLSSTTCRTGSSCATLESIGSRISRSPSASGSWSSTGLPSEFPAIRSLDATPNNLPTHLTTFLGREHEMAEVIDLLERSRLLTLTGPGGTGKTRLSLEVARRSMDRFPDGVYFVELASITRRGPGPADRGAWPSTCPTGAVGLRWSASPITLARSASLLVLDNFEQVVEAAPAVGEPAGRVSEPGRPCEQPDRTSHLRRAGVPVPPLGMPDPARLPSARPALAVRVGRALHRACPGGEARLRGDERERPGRGRDLRPARRPAAGNRARRRSRCGSSRLRRCLVV